MKYNNIPAFPRTMWTGSDKNNAHRDVVGMTLRDYFAGQALAGIISNSLLAKDIDNKVGNHTECCNVVAQNAYSYADAMLKEREK